MKSLAIAGGEVSDEARALIEKWREKPQLYLLDDFTFAFQQGRDECADELEALLDKAKP
jgi:hypothetical protein